MIKAAIAASIKTKEALLNDEVFHYKIENAAQIMIATFKSGGKVLFCGNGGSAADAQHLAAELSGRFYKNRAPLFAEALHVNSSFVTAVANDYGYNEVYARMVEAMGKPGDILVALSTSGNSANIIQAIDKAKSLEMTVVGLSGDTGGKMGQKCDILLNVPSSDTPRIQEAHILLGHILCEIVEENLFPQ